MKCETILSLKEARRLALCSQGLTITEPFGRGENAVLRCIDQLGYVQIDTISVIKRAHHHTLWTRVNTYSECFLDKLQLEDRKVFEYWHHAAAYLPMQDYRYFLPYMRAIAAGEKHWFKPDKKLMQRVLDRIKTEGPLMAKHFAPRNNKKPGAWWEWKPAKRALEQLFIEGKLMVRQRVNFHKVYDVPENILPPNVDTSLPMENEFCRFLILRAIRAHGVVTEPEISYLRKGIKPAVRQELQKLLADGQVIEIGVEKLNQPYFTTPEKLATINKVRPQKRVFLLSPFDNVVIQRKRLFQLFNFDYQLECYVPQPKRVFGYFCLPILYGDRFVGRLDLKADRKNGRFLLRNLYLEKNVHNLPTFAQALKLQLVKLAEFNEVPEIKIEQTQPQELGELLSRLLKIGNK